MENTTLPKPSKGRTTPWFNLPRPIRLSNQPPTPRAKGKRLAISEPFGPIKNSRGPDFSRSDKFVIIDAINDCVGDNPAPSKENSLAAQKVRRLSASFPQARPPLAASPVVSASDVTITTTLRGAPLGSSSSTHQLRKASLAPSYSSQGLASASRLNLLSRLRGTHQDENVAPSIEDSDSKVVDHTLTASKLPKSRTMSVLREIKTSVSRPSLTTRSSNMTTVKHSPSSADMLTPDLSQPRLPRSSTSSLTPSSPARTPETSHGLITTAQSSQYWSGRFMALYDRSLMHNLGPEYLNEHVVAHNRLAHRLHPSRSQRPTHLSLSTTTSALNTLTSAPAPRHTDDNDTRCRRIFTHLDSLCVSSEAKRSLHSWQQSFARVHGREGLLPQGGSMEERSLISRLFGSGGGKSDKGSPSASKDTFEEPRAKRPSHRHYSRAS